MKVFELSDEDLAELKEIASSPVVIWNDPQERANAKWREVGERMGFDYTTVRPADGHGVKFFEAEEK